MPYRKTLIIQHRLAAVWPSHSTLSIFLYHMAAGRRLARSREDLGAGARGESQAQRAHKRHTQALPLTKRGGSSSHARRVFPPCPHSKRQKARARSATRGRRATTHAREHQWKRGLPSRAAMRRVAPEDSPRLCHNIEPLPCPPRAHLKVRMLTFDVAGCAHGARARAAAGGCGHKKVWLRLGLSAALVEHPTVEIGSHELSAVVGAVAGLAQCRPSRAAIGNDTVALSQVSMSIDYRSESSVMRQLGGDGDTSHGSRAAGRRRR